MSQNYLKFGMSEAHKGQHGRIFSPDKHPEAYAGHLAGLITALHGEDLAYWHDGMLANDERVGQGYRFGLARGKELIKDGKHLDRSDHQILATRSELDGLVKACAEAKQEADKAKAMVAEANSKKAEIDKATAQAAKELEVLLEKHREYKISNFNASVLSQERIELMVLQDQLRSEIEMLEKRRDELITAQPVTAEQETAHA